MVRKLRVLPAPHEDVVLFAALSSQLLVRAAPEDLPSSSGFCGYIDTGDIPSQSHIPIHICINQNENNSFITEFSIHFISLYYINNSVTYLFIYNAFYLFFESFI